MSSFLSTHSASPKSRCSTAAAVTSRSPEIPENEERDLIVTVAYSSNDFQDLNVSCTRSSKLTGSASSKSTHSSNISYSSRSSSSASVPSRYWRMEKDFRRRHRQFPQHYSTSCFSFTRLASPLTLPLPSLHAPTAGASNAAIAGLIGFSA